MTAVKYQRAVTDRPKERQRRKMRSAAGRRVLKVLQNTFTLAVKELQAAYQAELDKITPGMKTKDRAHQLKAMCMIQGDIECLAKVPVLKLRNGTKKVPAKS